MASRSRSLNFVFSADAKQVVKAFQQTDAQAAKSAKHQEQTHRRMNQSWAGMGKNALKAGAGIAAAYVSIAKAKDAISSTQELAKATSGLHRNLGLSIETASRWAAVAKARGVDNKALTMSFTTLSKNVEAATHGGKKQQEAFKALGLTQADLKKGSKDFNGLLLQTADGFGKLKGGTERQATAQKLLGKGYSTLLPLFAEGSKSLKEQLHWADQYGVTLDKKTLQPINKLTAAQRELKVAQLGLKVAFTRETAPALLTVETAALKVLRVMNDKNLTGEEKWKKIGDIVGPLGDKLTKGVLEAIPKIADKVGQQAPVVAEAFVRGFLKANVWGKLAIGAFLVTKMGGWGALAKAGTSAGARWGAGFGAGAAPGVAAAGAGGAGAGGVAGAAKGGKLGGFKGMAGGGFILPATLAITGLELSGAASNQLKNIQSGNSTVDSALSGAGTAAKYGISPIRLGWKVASTEVKTIAKWTGITHENIKAINVSSKGLPSNIGTIRKFLDPKAFGAWANNLESLRKGTFTNLSQIRRSVDQNLDIIHDKFQDGSKQSADALGKNFKAAVKNVRILMRDGTISTDKGMGEIARLMKTHSGAGRDDMAAAFRGAIRDVKQSMKDGKTTTSAGLKDIRSLMKQYLTNFGYTGRQADLYLQNRNPTTGGPDEGNARIKKYAGGWIGMQGEAGPDTVPAMLGRGEAVLNRYQQQPVETALRSTYGMGLDDLFAREQRPHYMATGGRVRNTLAGLQPGIASAVQKVTGKFPLTITSTTGGGHASGSYHYRGMAADLAGSPGLMHQASQWIKASGMARSLAEGIHNPNLSVKGGRSVPSSYWGGTTWGNHANHIHLAVAGALGKAGVDSSTAARLARVIVRGPDSPIKGIVQRGLDRARAAGQSRLDSLAPASGGGDSAYPAMGGGGDSAANMVLGKRMLGNAREWPALRELWMGESGWNNTARNASSGAYGIPQALPPSKMGAAANPPSSSPGAQISWGLGYIASRYGSPSKALSAWRGRSPHWYGRGGFAGKRMGARGGRSPNVHSQRTPNMAGGRGLTPIGGRGGTFVLDDSPSPISAGGVGSGLEFPVAATLLDFINENASLAQLTADTADDLAAAGQRVQYYEAALAQATSPAGRTAARGELTSARQEFTQAAGGTASDKYQQALSDIDLQNRAGLLTDDQATAARGSVFTKALAGEYGGLSDRERWQIMADQRDAAKALADAAQSIADSQKALADEVKRMNDFNARVESVTGTAAVRALADLVSGNLGPKYANKARTPGSGRIGSVAAA